MKTFMVSLYVMVLALTLNAAAFAQFNDRSPAFSQPGSGEADKEYTFIVPDGVTIETSQGETYKGGETIGIPGKYIELLATDRAKEVVSSGRAVGQQTEMTTVEMPNYGVIMLTIPEGVTVTRKDGTEMKGPTSVPMVVTVADLQLSEETKRKYRRLQWGSQ